MTSRYPKIIYTEEGMREGMQIEDTNIPVDSKVELLDALSETGLKQIVVGSFVSPKYTPQMARIDEIVSKFHGPGPERERVGAGQAVFAPAHDHAQPPAAAARASMRCLRPPQHQPHTDAGNGGMAKSHRHRSA